MIARSLHAPFEATHPLGLPRPIDAENFFGAKPHFFARNLMPVPSGCLEYFDGATYRPYVAGIVAFLNRVEYGWSGPAVVDGPLRYCLLRDGAPAQVPPDLRPLLPEPPRVKLEAVLCYFDRHHGEVPQLQLLDLIAMVREDVPPAKFAAAAARHLWVGTFGR